MTDPYANIRRALKMLGPGNSTQEQIAALDDLDHACDPDTIRALLAERDELAKDAARYLWLRDRWGRIADEYDGDSDQLVAIREADSHFEGWDVDPVSLDRAIDAAMQHDTGSAP